jgi:hypothetical protein
MQLGSPEVELQEPGVVGLLTTRLFCSLTTSPEPADQRTRDAGLDPLAGPLTFDQDSQVVRVTVEPVAMRFQFLVRVI